MRHRMLWSALLVAAACKTSPSAVPQTAAKPVAPAGNYATDSRPLPPGLALDAMNLAVSPCDDFYEFACGTWVKNAEIPADRSRWSRSFDVIAVRNEDTLHTILESVSKGKAPEGQYPADKLADVYGGCMNTAQLEKSLPVLKSELRKVTAASSPKALALSLARLHLTGTSALFSYTSNPDYDNAGLMVAEVDQAGLGLPDRDYYLSADAKKKEVLAAYQTHLEKLFGLLGENAATAKKDATAVVALETEIARASLDRVSRRDPKNSHHRIERVGLKTAAPLFPWDDYFKAMGTPRVEAINVTHPPFFQEVSVLTQATPARTWASYLTIQYVEDHVLALPQAFADERFHFTSTALTGQKEDAPRWKKCVRLTDALMGEALGVPYVNQTFGADGKKQSVDIVTAIEGAFERNLAGLDWMDAATKTHALEKTKHVMNKIGYPDSWRDYSELKTDRKNFLLTFDNGVTFETHRRLTKIGQPSVRTEWLMTPPTVNAYCNPQTNEITFPAGILQPPFFDRHATPAVNFGSIGMVAGHELTHAFDDEGRKFDAAGNLVDWWTPASGEAFVKRTDCVKRQFDAYVAIDDLHVNGALTLGENVADLGGIKLAHAAMVRYLAEHPADSGGTAYRFTPSQQFFLGYAQAWCSKVRPEAARVRVQTDSHSPPFLRVNGPLRNSDDFRTAFQCAAGTKMTRTPAERCQVW